jgi:hypothetical protein
MVSEIGAREQIDVLSGDTTERQQKSVFSTICTELVSPPGEEWPPQWVARALEAHQKSLPNISPSRNRPSGFNERERGENKQGADKGAARKTANDFCAVCAIYITLGGDGGRASHRESSVRYRAACKKQSPGALSAYDCSGVLRRRYISLSDDLSPPQSLQQEVRG